MKCEFLLLACSFYFTMATEVFVDIINEMTRGLLKQHHNYNVQIVYSTNRSLSTQLQRTVYSQLFEDWPVLHYDGNDKKDLTEMNIEKRAKCTVNIILVSATTLQQYMEWVCITFFFIV